MKFAGILCVFLVVSMIFVPIISIGKNSVSVSSSPLQTSVSEKSENNEKIKVYISKTGKVEKVDLTEYTIGAVCAEISPSYEEEAIMAQAIACKTYAVYMMENDVYDKADISDDYTKHQGYISKDELKEKWGEKFETYYQKIESAVKKVENKILTYDGKVIQTAFFALCGGKTENAKDIWGNEVPYLKSVNSVGDELAADNTSVVSYSVDEFRNCCENLEKCKLSDNKSEWVGETKKTDAGSVKNIVIGSQSYTGAKIQSVFNLKSINFNLKYDGENFVFTVIGNGHGVGMSQYGADYMARQGSSCEEILKHYYTSVEISEY